MRWIIGAIGGGILLATSLVACSSSESPSRAGNTPSSTPTVERETTPSRSYTPSRSSTPTRSPVTEAEVLRRVRTATSQMQACNSRISSVTSQVRNAVGASAQERAVRNGISALKTCRSQIQSFLSFATQPSAARIFARTNDGTEAVLLARSLIGIINGAIQAGEDALRRLRY